MPPYGELERRTSGSDDDDLEARRQSVGRHAVATLLCTADTTGRPKEVVLTHDALLYEAEAIADTGLVRMTDLQLLYLPLARSLGKVLIVAWLATGHVVSLLLTLDPQAVRERARELGLGNRSYAELTQTHEVRRLVSDVVADFNRQLPSFETIERFEILEHDFSVEAGELTSSLEVRRRVVYDRYQTLFDALYDEHT